MPPIMAHLTDHDAVNLLKNILGENEVESVLQRLDRLTPDEARITATQTLDVVHGLIQNMRVVINGEATQWSRMSIQYSVFNTLFYRRNSISRRYLGFSKYVWIVRSDYHVPNCIVDIMQEILDKMNEARRKHIPFIHVAHRGR